MPTFIKEIGWVDAVAFGAVAFLVIRGFVRGCSGELGRLVAICAAAATGFFGFAPVSRLVLQAQLFQANPYAGRLIAFLDADDRWLPHKLEAQVAYFHAYPQTGLLHTATTGRPGDASSVAVFDSHPRPPRHVFCELFHTDYVIATLTVMVRRDVLDSVGLFDERREVHVEDWDLWLRIAASYPVGYLAQPAAVRVLGGSMSAQQAGTLTLGYAVAIIAFIRVGEKLLQRFGAR